MGRQRPAGQITVPTVEEQDEAQAAAEASLADLDDAMQSVMLRLNRISHPLERAKAIRVVRAATTGPLADQTDDMFRAALMEAYAVGRTQSGWMGYGAIADALSMSRSRVQQVINGTWKKGGKDLRPAQELRAQADLVRGVTRAAAAGESSAEIAERFGVSEAQVKDLTNR